MTFPVSHANHNQIKGVGGGRHVTGQQAEQPACQGPPMEALRVLAGSVHARSVLQSFAKLHHSSSSLR